MTVLLEYLDLQIETLWSNIYQQNTLLLQLFLTEVLLLLVYSTYHLDKLTELIATLLQE